MFRTHSVFEGLDDVSVSFVFYLTIIIRLKNKQQTI